MAYGIHVENTGGKTIIDENFINYIEVASGSASVTGPAYNSGDPPDYNNITVSGYTYSSKDLVFVQMTGWVGDGVFFSSGSSSTLQIGSFGTGTLKYRIFRNIDISASPSTSGYGLEVFKANGGLAFSSNYRVANIITTISGTYPISGTFYWGSFYDITTQPWICCSVGVGVTGSDANASYDFTNYAASGVLKVTTVKSIPKDSFGVGRYGVATNQYAGYWGVWEDQGTALILVLRGY